MRENRVRVSSRKIWTRPAESGVLGWPRYCFAVEKENVRIVLGPDGKAQGLTTRSCMVQAFGRWDWWVGLTGFGGLIPSDEAFIGSVFGPRQS